MERSIVTGGPPAHPVYIIRTCKESKVRHCKFHTALASNLLGGHGAALHHGGVLFLEALLQAGGALQVLVNAAHHTGFFAVDQGLGGEIGDTVIEAALDHLGIHLS